MEHTNNIKPILKWVGGKRQLLPVITELMPQKFNKYIEPFIGGGAVFFHLSRTNSVINDYNSELINLYNVIKSSPEELISHLKTHIHSEEYYYNIRSLDRNPSVYSNLSDIERASRIIYLNRTCFNGLYRVNKKGQFNVPYGKYKNPNWVNEENILLAHKLLQKTDILCGDFENIIPYINEGDFIYLDPPYIPLNKTSSFTSYTDSDFDFSTQERLKNMCDLIHEKGAFFMLSNSYTQPVLDLYQNYDIKEVNAKRAINSNPEKRGNVKEVIVKNY